MWGWHGGVMLRCLTLPIYGEIVVMISLVISSNIMTFTLETNLHKEQTLQTSDLFVTSSEALEN